LPVRITKARFVEGINPNSFASSKLGCPVEMAFSTNNFKNFLILSTTV